MEFLVCFLWKEKGRQFLFFLISHWLTSEYIYIFICILNNCVNRKKLGHYIFCMDWQDAIVIRWLVSQPNVQIVWQILVMIEMGGSNVCAFNRSQKRCFMMFYSVLLRFICILLHSLCSAVYLSFLLWHSSDPKEKNSFYAFIMNNKVLLYLYCIVVVVRELILDSRARLVTHFHVLLWLW